MEGSKYFKVRLKEKAYHSGAPRAWGGLLLRIIIIGLLLLATVKGCNYLEKLNDGKGFNYEEGY